MSDPQFQHATPESVLTENPRMPADPVAAFSELLANCVPQLCDACWIELDVDGRPRQRIDVPSAGSSADSGTGRHLDDRIGPPLRSVPHTAVARGRHDVPFTGDPTPTAPAFSGVASFQWWSQVPSTSDGVVVNLLVELTVRNIAWQRSLQARDASAVHIEQLQTALTTNRRIGAAVGIVMSTRKLTQDQAFELLATVSQRTNRKLQQIADQVLETGWLDPALTPAG